MDKRGLKIKYGFEIELLCAAEEITRTEPVPEI